MTPTGKKDEKKKPAQESAPPAAAPAPTAPAAAEPEPKPVVVDDRPVRTVKPGERTKTTLQATRTLSDEAERARVKADLEQQTPRAAMARTIEAAEAATAPAAKWKAISGPKPVGAASSKTTVAPAVVTATVAPVSGPAAAGDGKKGTPIQLPAWFQPDPNDPFPLTPDDAQVEFYPILEPYAYVLITFNNKDKETMYRVLEPRLTPDETKILRFIEHTMVDILDADPNELMSKSAQEYLGQKFDEILYDYAIVLGETEAQEQEAKKKLLYYIYRDFIGEGRIDTMTRDEMIEDISCDGAHQPVFLYHRKYEGLKSNVKFANDPELDSYVIRLAQRAGKHISIADPILDATMRDGSRLQATLSREVSANGSTFTIRKFRTEPFTPPDLVRFGTMSAEILAYWWIAIQFGSSAIYAGGTASGKTTSLNAILLFIPPQMKIVSIEDTRELSLPHPNWIPGITRTGFGVRDASGRQVGEIDMFQLLKNALRQRPEYIIVGEVRGKEAYNLFQAMATGHAAYGTMHADSVDAVIHRLESDPINIPRSLLEALDIVSIQTQTRVGGKRVRRTKQLAEIVGIDPHTREILTNEVFRWQPKDDSFKFSGVSYVLERIQVEKGMTPQQMKLELENRVEIIKYMIRHSVRNYKDVARIVSTYYKDPAMTMERVRKDEDWS